MSVDISTLSIEVRSDGVLVASNRLKDLSAEGGRAEVSTNKLSSSFDKASGYIKAAAAALATLQLARFINDTIQTQLQVERLNRLFAAAAGSASAAAREMGYIRGVTNRLGLDIMSTTESYGKFMAAIRGTKIEGEAGRKVFESVSAASTALGLRAEETSGIFNALQQMMSKGKVQAEELRGQLGERLPGAFRMAADAMGVSTAELDKNMAAGKVLAEDLLPRLAEQLNKTYGIAATEGARSAQAEINRFNNAMIETKAAAGSSLLPVFVDILNAIKPALGMLRDFIGGIKMMGNEAAGLVEKLAISLNPKMLFNQDYAEAAVKRFAQINKDVDELNQDVYKRMSGDYSGLNGAMAALSGGSKGGNHIASITTATHAAADANKRWAATYVDLRGEIAALNPHLTEQGKETLDLNTRYDALLKQFPKHVSELQKLRAEHIAATKAAEQWKEALAIQDNMNTQWEGEQKLRAERATTAAQYEIQLKEQQGLRQGALQLQIEMENAALAEKGVYEGQVKVLKDKVDAYRLAAEAEKTAREARQAEDTINGTISDLQTSLISDPFEQEKRELANRYEYERKLQEETLKRAEKFAGEHAKAKKAQYLLEQKYIKETAEVDADAQRAKLQATSFYTGMAGDLFAQLASMQDESSRKGFEAAKDYNLAAAIVSTAAAVMNALATVQPYPAAVAAAAMAAATGAIQIAKIESTSFGGGSSSVSAPSGSFTASGGGAAVGSAIGNPYRTVQQSQDADSMNRLADSMDNASLEMRRVADGLISFQDVLSTELGKRNIEGAPNRFMATSNESSWLHKAGGIIMDSLGFESTKYIREGDWGGLFKQLKDFSLSAGGGLLGNALWGQGNKWKTTGGGVSLGIADGDLAGMTYTDRKKSGGLLKSSKKKTDYSALDEGFAYWLENTLGDVGYSTNLAATILGTKANIGGVQLPATKIKTAGRSTEDIQKDLEKWFQTVGNAFAKTVEGLEAFTAPGEEAFAALMRLSMALQDVNANFNLIGKTLIDSSLAGGNSASKLTDLFGGLEGFNESMATYFESMFTDAEQKAALQKQAQIQVNASFKEMGLSIPKTREEFKSLVNSLDVTTEKGASLFAALMDVVPAFTVLTEAAEEASKRLSEAFLDTALSASSVLRDIMTGSLSTMTPRQILMQQEASFASALATGNTAILPELGRQILETSRQVYGSGSGYTTNYNNVTSALAGVAGIDGTLTLDKVERQIYAITAVQDAVNNGTARLVTSIAELKEEIAKLRQQQGEGTEAVVDAVTGTFAAVARA